MKLSRKLGWGSLVLAGALSTTTTTGCYGTFNLTQRLWHWNGHVSENKWAHEGIFLVMIIIPVYQVCTWVDAIFFNSWKFWTGKDLIDAPSGDTKTTGKIDDNHEYTLTRLSDSTVGVELFENGQLQKSFTIDQSNGENSVLRDIDGTVLGVAETQADGSVKLVAAH